MGYCSETTSTVYPRVCGGTHPRFGPRKRSGGLSPRVRGHPIDQSVSVSVSGSIPACAGAPIGGPELQPYMQGLSPRVRGHHVFIGRCGGVYGSIPACAGAPPFTSSFFVCVRLYPRACGATKRRVARKEWLRGLSPRLRGHPVRNAPILSERVIVQRSVRLCYSLRSVYLSSYHTHSR